MERTRKQYSVQLEDEIVERVDKLAEKIGVTRSQMLRTALITGLEEGEFLNRTGVITIVKFGMDLKEKFFTDFLSGKLKLNKKGDWEVEKK